MRRALALLMAVMAVAGGCSSNKDKGAASGKGRNAGSSTTAAPSSTVPSNPGTVSPSTGVSADCHGLGPAPQQGAVTWVARGRLLDESGCLIDHATTVSAWGGKADRVLLGDTVVVGQSAPVKPFDGPGVLSRPTGTAVLQVTPEGRLAKRELGSPDTVDITFMAKHEKAVYHPAGRTIVSVGRGDDGSTEFYIADNQGQDARLLTKTEDARDIANITFTASGALLFVAEHDDKYVLHRQEIDAGKLTTIAEVAKPAVVDHVVTSPFSGGGVAWTQGQCGSAVLRAERNGKYLDLKATMAEHAEPVGWLPDGSLVVLARRGCTLDTPGTVGVVAPDGRAVREVAKEATSAAVRAVLPPPPAPPKSIPQEAPA
ncbi:MAG: hypothetical protein QOI20_2502 [Acidimicrobiaceae bacterium]|nr:hypothetical protein [Acidimicrobiaceae bacterium]